MSNNVERDRKIEEILNNRISHKMAVVINFNNWSILCKQLWIGGLAVLFWNLTKPLFLENRLDLIWGSVTLVNRALFGGVILTILFWCIDGVTWFFQRQLRRDVEEMELFLWQISNMDSKDFIGISEWDYLIRKNRINPNYLSINQPTFWSATFNKSLIVYMAMCLLLSLLSLLSYILVNRNILGAVGLLILVVSFWYLMRRWYEDIKNNKNSNICLIICGVLAILLFYFGIHSIIKKFIKSNLSFSVFEVWRLFISLLKNTDSNSQAYENVVIFSGLSFICAIILFMGIHRVEKMVKRNNERMEFFEGRKINICVLYSLRTSKINGDDLRLFHEQLSKIAQYSIFIDYVDNFNNKMTNNWRGLVKEKIRSADFVIVVDRHKKDTKSTRYETNLLNRFNKKRIYFSVDEIRELSAVGSEKIMDIIKNKLDTSWT